MKQFKDKHLLVQTNQQEYPNYEINSWVPMIPSLWLNHTLDLLVTVLLWCSGMKPMNFKGSFTSSSVVNHLSRINRLIDTFFLFLFKLLVFNVKNVIFKTAFNNRIWSLTLDQGQAPTCASKSKILSQLWYQYIGT